MNLLREKINEDLKAALRGKEERRVLVLRMLVSSVRNKEISLRSGEDVESNEEQLLEVISSEIKKRKDSVESYSQGGREDLAEIESAEIKILEEYLPEQMTDEDLETLTREIISAQEGATLNFGLLMGKLMPLVKGRADGSRVTGIVKKILAG